MIRIYHALSFVAGFSLMAVELLSERIVSPYMGSSIYTWTSVIGVILLGLSIGSFLGGRLIDRRMRLDTLAYAFLASGLAVALIPPLSGVQAAFIRAFESVYALNLTTAAVLFLLPAVVIGSLQPMIVRLSVKSAERIGSEYGLLSAIWSLGSIAGVFATGLFFVSYFGTKETIFIMSGVLLAAGVLLVVLGNGMKRAPFALAIAFVSLALPYAAYSSRSTGHPATTSVLYEGETPYYSVQIADFTYPTIGRARGMFLDAGSHSIEPEVPTPFIYTESSYPLFAAFRDAASVRDILVIGGAAYTLPKRMDEFYPDAKIAVIEIDGSLEALARRFFKLESPDVGTITGDARSVLARDPKKYDGIFGDAYNSFVSIPWHLGTVEAHRLVRERLNDGGVYAFAFIGSFDEEKGEATRSILKSFSEVFPSPYVFALGTRPSSVQNIIVVGVKGEERRPFDEIRASLTASSGNGYLAAKLLDELPFPLDGALVLRDNYAPLERLMLPLVDSEFSKYHEEFYSRVF